MASWQARTVAWFIRTVVRRHDWGQPAQLARRARRYFGPPVPWQWWVVRRLRVERVAAPVTGEWLSAGAWPAVVLYIHGGGYVSCSSRTHRPIGAAFARHFGLRVFSVDYRLAPEHPFPAAIDDVTAAYEWLLASGVPSSRIAVAGDSAGGGLALALCIRLREQGSPLPACVVCFSPWTDLAGTGESLRNDTGRDSMFVRDNIEQFARAIVGAAPRTDPLVSPVYARLDALPPLMLQVGEEELLVDDARRVHEHVLASGGSSTLAIVPGVFHGWQLCAGLVPEADQSLNDAGRFMREHLSTRAAT